ncbi:hypothetical protein [Arthrobacter sp. ISL-65]|uniref:hypothetical protein n=1 Tax=Arthrobacter sp. ISL-65 TaxID=2819112 RepID=UPI001BE76388|nr:hypothetical protein [Arthrobacter sp. ISL-65]MBT2548085.1 hypothetical protein [Arthrobacter sp. ISL-65]
MPFHYFGVSNDVDLRRLEWKRGSYDIGQLDALAVSPTIQAEHPENYVLAGHVPRVGTLSNPKDL